MRHAGKDIKAILLEFRGAFLAILVMSALVNMLALTGSFYMLQVYDRVLTSHSVPTLIAFSMLAACLYVFQGVLDVLRAQILVRIGIEVDKKAMPIAHETLLKLPLYGASTTDARRPVRDVEKMRSFLGSQGPIAIFDLPWMPLYLVFVYILHPWLGILATAGLLVLITLTFFTEQLNRGLNANITQLANRRAALADTNAGNAEVLRAMGFCHRATRRFGRVNAEYLNIQTKSSDIGGGLSGISRVFRMLLQSAVLGLGAYLTLQGEVTAGAIIAASIATSRAFAPIELAISHWKSFVSARQAFMHLQKTVAALPSPSAPLELMAPADSLTLEKVTAPIPGTQHLILHNISFCLTTGDGLGVIGQSGSGKSTLARVITGIWPLARGAVRLDGADIDRWPAAYFRDHIGYLPQSISLMDGTIAENISRFAPNAEATDIICAAKAANVHELILRLPEGYETRLAQGGSSLSAGQCQRIALARALYRDPFLVVLDEPNSNLDTEGDAALTKALEGVCERGGIAVVIAHRPSALHALNKVAVIRDGQLASFGPKHEILRDTLVRQNQS